MPRGLPALVPLRPPAQLHVTPRLAHVAVPAPAAAGRGGVVGVAGHLAARVREVLEAGEARGGVGVAVLGGRGGGVAVAGGGGGRAARRLERADLAGQPGGGGAEGGFLGGGEGFRVWISERWRGRHHMRHARGEGGGGAEVGTTRCGC